MTLNRETQFQFDVVIAGGSHAGLSMALALAHLAGPELRVAVVERRPIRTSDVSAAKAGVADPRAFALGAASRHLLTALGCWKSLEAFAQPVDAVDITDTSLENAIRPVLLSYDNHIGDDGAREKQAAMHIVEADPLRKALHDGVLQKSSITLLAPAEVRAFEAGAAGIDITLGDGRHVAAALLIAADGAKSPIREAAGIKVQASPLSQVGIVANVTHERPHGSRAVQHFLPSGPFAILPLVGNRSCVTWTEEAKCGREIVALDDQAFVAELQQRFGFKLGAVALSGPRAVWPLEPQVARSLIAPRVALIGDAARTVHPIAGQGLNQGLRDVAALAEVVVDAMRLGLDAADLTALNRYQQWRRFDTTTSSAAFAALNTLFSNDQAALRMLRDAGLGLVDRLPGLKQIIVKEAAGLTGELPRLLQAPSEPNERMPA